MLTITKVKILKSLFGIADQSPLTCHKPGMSRQIQKEISGSLMKNKMEYGNMNKKIRILVSFLYRNDLQHLVQSIPFQLHSTVMMKSISLVFDQNPFGRQTSQI